MNAPSLTPSSRADLVYVSVREDIFDMHLLPGDRVTEASIAERFGVSRTPAREALLRLQSDGLMRGYVRGGWEVVPIDFKRFEDLYEMRQLIETFAVSKLFDQDGVVKPNVPHLVERLEQVWKVPSVQRLRGGREMVALDEAFHQALVWAADNAELTSAMQRVTDRIRVVRRLDLVRGDCIDETYDEHVAILEAIHAGDKDRSIALIARHIEGSRAAVRTMTAERLEHARTARRPDSVSYAPPRVRGPA
ncbi:GntR family transcriptional regulator [Burkholderia cenocepacia]|uniref:GntR family transcriptional regulator n=1 Tax=Burkholderia cenocepacia TaxID=95486 RepID=A0ABD4US92_9BURK|nr:GntR family transcriptional regulator [Burkholderia cenocepacia]MBN3532423.1 GntR family transcriptional regulator [Burkholderia cenocepacia]MBO1855583.1 GntR family transcriptional regulator [Burkholderia cenocepacia]MBR8029745.1 GntR family transcriptional regulator [Burkholderia cenocepacia]MBR8172613.1 GntR family transcriptional regulator [Burkholderia cenocepacia]MBR8426561.1 GntR family transcriptional regulator [Burkholderia cenocepacia]